MTENNIIEHIKELCAERQWSYYKLAKESGIAYSTIGTMLSKTAAPSMTHCTFSQVADYTASREFHPAPKNLPFFIFVIIILF